MSSFRLKERKNTESAAKSTRQICGRSEVSSPSYLGREAGEIRLKKASGRVCHAQENGRGDASKDSKFRRKRAGERGQTRLLFSPLDRVISMNLSQICRSGDWEQDEWNREVVGGSRGQVFRLRFGDGDSRPKLVPSARFNFLFPPSSLLPLPTTHSPFPISPSMSSSISPPEHESMPSVQGSTRANSPVPSEKLRKEEDKVSSSFRSAPPSPLPGHLPEDKLSYLSLSFFHTH